MKSIVPTLSLLALAAGPLMAEVVSDEAAKITVGLMSQARADVGRGSDVNGDSFSPSENAAGKPDTADFYLRRFRPSIKGTFGDGFVFSAVLAADNVGRNAAAGTNVTLFEGYGGKKFTDGDLTHTITLGKRNAWFYTGNFNQTSGLFPSFRPTTPLGIPNDVGLSYKLEAPIVRFGFDIQNNRGGDDQANGSQGDNEGLWYSARVELTGEGDWASAWQESFAGKPGHGFVIGLEAGSNQRDRAADVDTATAGNQAGHTTTVVYGIEGMIHLDALTAVADVRRQKAVAVADTAASPDDVTSQVWTIQAGYALNTGAALLPTIEPAIRFSRIDRDQSKDEGAKNFGASANDDYGASGNQLEIGINGYFNGHKNKLALEYIRWVSEGSAADSGATATANIIRLQHQLMF